MCSVIIPQAELALKNISNYNLNKQIINIKETKQNFNQNLLPLTIKESYYGNQVLLEEKEKFIY